VKIIKELNNMLGIDTKLLMVYHPQIRWIDKKDESELRTIPEDVY